LLIVGDFDCLLSIEQSTISNQQSAIKKGHRHLLTMPQRFLRATWLPSNSRLPAVNIQAACTHQLSK
jgi:hypothetical protein